MLFDELGIYGWDVVEPLVLAAIVADLPVLLIGDIGTNKTEGSKTIAQAVLGATSQFRHYEVPTLNFDDLVGFLNPQGLAKGALEFISTPLSIWKAEAALIISRPVCSNFISSYASTKKDPGISRRSIWRSRCGFLSAIPCLQPRGAKMKR